MNLVRIVFNHARTQPHVPALVDGDRTFTYRDLAAIVARTATHLAALGTGPGDRVGICLKDRWEYAVAVVAIAYSGAVVVPMDWRARAQENARIADALATKLVLVEEGASQPLGCPTVPTDANWHRAVEGAAPFGGHVTAWDAPLILAPSSGTTGMPKFTVGTHLQMYFRSTVPLYQQTRVRPMRFLSVLPMCFAGGYQRCLTSLVSGDTVVMHPTLFTPAEYVDAVGRNAIDYGLVVPMIVRQLLQIAGPGGRLLPDTMSLATSGSPLFAEEKQDAVHRVAANFIEVYGNSAIGAVTQLGPADIAERPDSVGQPLPTVEVEVVDDADRPLGPDAVGLMRFRGPGLGTPLAVPRGASGTSELRGGWFYPGDFAALDARGFLFVKGRTSDVIMRGGAKIHPDEIEVVLLDHDAIAEAAVVGSRDQGNEESIIAFVVVRRPIDPSELLAACRARLTPYKVPREIRVVTTLPRNSAGKVSRRDLAALVENPPA